LHAVASFVDRYAHDRAVVWVDDQLGRAAETWAARRSMPTHLVAVDGRNGLNADHVAHVLDFAKAHRDVGGMELPTYPVGAPGTLGVRRALFLAARGCSAWLPAAPPTRLPQRACTKA
jgi:hypothetical protein